MRILLSAAGCLLMTLSAGANTKDVDCDALRGTTLPYQTTFAASEATGGNGGPIFAAQYYRRGNGWIGILVRFSGEADVAVHEGRYGLMTRTTPAGQAASTEIVIEGVSLDRDPFADRQDFSYTQHVRPPAGPPQTDEYTARFRGEDTITVSGCSFRVAIWQIERHTPAPRPGQVALSNSTFWYAPDLGSSLRLRSGIGESNPYDLTAASIETRFDRFE